MEEDQNSGKLIDAEQCATLHNSYVKDAQTNQILSCFFGINKITKVLGQDGCMGIRIKLAKDSNGMECLVLVGVNTDNNDLDKVGNVIVEYGVAQYAQK